MNTAAKDCIQRPDDIQTDQVHNGDIQVHNCRAKIREDPCIYRSIYMPIQYPHPSVVVTSVKYVYSHIGILVLSLTLIYIVPDWMHWS